MLSERFRPQFNRGRSRSRSRDVRGQTTGGLSRTYADGSIVRSASTLAPRDGHLVRRWRSPSPVGLPSGRHLVRRWRSPSPVGSPRGGHLVRRWRSPSPVGGSSICRPLISHARARECLGKTSEPLRPVSCGGLMGRESFPHNTRDDPCLRPGIEGRRLLIRMDTYGDGSGSNRAVREFDMIPPERFGNSSVAGGGGGIDAGHNEGEGRSRPGGQFSQIRGSHERRAVPRSSEIPVPRSASLPLLLPLLPCAPFLARLIISPLARSLGMLSISYRPGRRSAHRSVSAGQARAGRPGAVQPGAQPGHPP